MRPDDIMNIGQRAATEQDSIENELIAENKRLRDELRILRYVVRELEAHLESLQNRYALVTAENDTLRGFQDCRDDKGDFLYEQWKDRQREKDDE